MKKLCFMSYCLGALLGLLSTVSAYATSGEAIEYWLKKSSIDYQSLLEKNTVHLNNVKSLVEEILSKGGDSVDISYVLNKKIGDNNTLLHQAVFYYDTYLDARGDSLSETVKYLLEQGVDPRVLNKRGETALTVLAQSTYPFKLETAKLLYNAYPESVHMANEFGKSVLQSLFWAHSLDIRTQDAKRSQATFEFVKFLIEKKINLNHQDRFGDTVLHTIAEADYTNSQAGDVTITSLRLLMGSGADPSIKNNLNETPFHLSSKRDKYKMSALFLQNKAQGFTAKGNGVTPLERARDKGNVDMVNLIKAYEAKLSLTSKCKIAFLNFWLVL